MRRMVWLSRFTMVRGKFRFPFRLQLDKRKKFVLSVLILSFGLLISQYIKGGERIIASFVLALLSLGSLFLIIRVDIKGVFNFPLNPLFILPFFYTLALGLFYFLIPERLLTRIIVTSFFAITLYALFLSHNIYAVSSIRTIALLRAANTVNFFLTIVAFFILVNIIFTLHLMPYFLFLAVLIVSFPLIVQNLWSVALESKISKLVLLFFLVIALLIAQMATMLSFWPVLPTVAALFLAGNFYTFVGLSQHWLERRLFRGVLWEYIWVIVVVFLVLIFATKWG